MEEGIEEYNKGWRKECSNMIRDGGIWEGIEEYNLEMELYEKSLESNLIRRNGGINTVYSYLGGMRAEIEVYTREGMEVFRRKDGGIYGGRKWAYVWG